MDFLPLIYLLTFLAGIVVSFVNSLAGGGSSLSLPLFVFAGLSPAEAHATNRFGALWGALASAFSLGKQAGQNSFPPLITWLALSLGTLSGTFILLIIPPRGLNTIIALTIIFMSFFSPASLENSKTLLLSELPKKLRDGMFFLVGFYGGFIQVGFGLVFMYLFSRTFKMGILQVNFLKGLSAALVLAISACVLGVFGKINLNLALIFSLGNIIGGFLGAQVQMHISVRKIRLFTSITGISLALWLLITTWT